MIDGNKVVLSISNPETRVDDAEFEENEVYAIDIVTSTGEGKVIMAFLCRKQDQSYLLMFCSSSFGIKSAAQAIR